MPSRYLRGEGDDSINNGAGRLESLDGLVAGNTGLLDDGDDVILSKVTSINLLAIILLISSGGNTSSRRSEGVSTHALRGSHLETLHEVISSSLTEDDVGLGTRGLEDLGLRDGEDVVVHLEGNTSDTLNRLEAKLGKSLAGLLLTTGDDLTVRVEFGNIREILSRHCDTI